MSQSITKKLLPELRYDSANDVMMRLKDTIVSYDGTPCLVYGIVDPSSSVNSLVVMCCNLLSGDEFWCHSSDELLDITSLPLGWCIANNDERSPVYVMRTTRTSQRQGIYPSSLDVWDPLNGGRVLHGYGYRRYQDLRSMAKMAMGEANPIMSVIATRYGGPLNRDWALINNRPDRGANFFVIYHKHVEVGTYRADRREFFFRRGRLTKTRRTSLEEMFALPINKGASYGIAQQT